MKQKLLFPAVFMLLSSVCTAQINLVSPPSSPVRTPAEWEEVQSVLVAWQKAHTWSHLAQYQFIEAARQECQVVVVCSTQSDVQSAKDSLTQNGVDISSGVSFAIARSNSVWIRDYGPNSVYTNDVDSLIWVDWLYNRITRKQDDTLARRILPLFQIPMYSTAKKPYDLVNTGGNFMADGLGTAFASKLIYTNNNQIDDGETSDSDVIGTSDHTDSSINAIMKAYMGIDRYIKMDKLPYDGIHHIDMHIKLLDEETLLVGEYPPGVSDGPQIEANVQYVLSQFKSAFNDQYKVVRIPMPSFGGNYPPYPGVAARYPTYINSVVLNRSVMVPVFNKVPASVNTAALDAYREALPGYQVVPVDCSGLIDRGGAIHCITKEVGVSDPLRIVHRPLVRITEGCPTCEEAHKVRALIQHRTGIDQAEVYYTINTPDGPYTSVQMSPITGTADQWEATLPNFNTATDSLVYYYIRAKSVSGKEMARPMPAPAGYWKAIVDLDISDVTTIHSAEFEPLYPNPGRGITCIPVQAAHTTNGVIRVFNALGQLIETVHQGEIPAGETNYFVNTSRYAAGAYAVVMQSEGNVVRQQMIVK